MTLDPAPRTPSSDVVPLVVEASTAMVMEMSRTPNPSVDAIDEARAALRDGDIGRARTLLSLPHDAPADDVILSAFIAYGQAEDHFSKGRLADAYTLYELMEPVFEASDPSENIWELFAIKVKLTGGAAKLMSGDGAGALEDFEWLAQRMEKYAFYLQDLEAVALSLRGLALMAVAKQALNAGDLDTYNAQTKQVEEVHKRMVAKCDRSKPEHWGLFFSQAVTSLELGVARALVAMSEFDLGATRSGLDGAARARAELEDLVPSAPPLFDRRLAEMQFNLSTAATVLAQAVESVVVGRRALTKDERSQLEALSTTLVLAEEQTQALGVMGAVYSRNIQRLRRIRSNLLMLGRPGKEDFGRYGGILSGIAFIAFVSILFAVFTPGGIEATIFVFVALILALIVGFGFSALHFMPFINLLLRRGTQARDGAPPAGGDA